MEKTTTTAKEIASALRERVLQLKSEDIGLNSSDQCPPVWGVVIETAHPDALASLVALVNGSVSFYVSDGNGCVGCGSQREVRWAGAELLQIAENAMPLTIPTDDLTIPPEGYVRCYLLTRECLRAVQAPLEEIGQIDERLSVLYFAGQRVIDAIERVGAGQSLAQEIRLAMNAINTHSSAINEESRDGALVGGELHDGKQGDQQCLSVGNVVRRLRN